MKMSQISSNQLLVWVALVLGLLAAVFVGGAVGGSNMKVLGILFGSVAALIIFANLRTNIWLMIPFGWMFDGRLNWLPLPFTVRDLCIIIPAMFYIGFFSLRIVSWKRKITTLDWLIYINLGYLVTVYARNPVGSWAFQSTMVGGRPYFAILLAFVAFIIINRANLTDLQAKIFPLFFVGPALLLGVADVVSRLSPNLGVALSMVYSGMGMLGSSMDAATFGETRFTGLQSFGTIGALALCAKYNPITLISPLYPMRVLLYVSCFVAIFLSGFRNAFLYVIIIFLLSTWLRRRLVDLWIAFGVVIIALVILIGLQGSVLQLPRTMQRTLSWLPGDWNMEAVADAEGSSQWRFEMWEWAWNDSRIMKDKIWGQGFGMSLEEMNIIADALMRRDIYGFGGAFIGGSDRENFMIMGSFHSGPLSSIRFVGVVGFVMFYTLMCYMAVLAWRLCRQAYGTRVFTLALFVGIPIIYEPFNFVVVFGALDSGFPQLIFWAALLNMTMKYLDTVEAEIAARPIPKADGQEAGVVEVPEGVGVA